MSDNLQLILRAVQEFDISVARAVKLIEIDREGEFNYDLLPYDAGTQAIFSFDEIPVQKYREVLAERDALVKDIRIANKNLFDTQEAAKIITKQAIAAEAERDALVNVERSLRRMLCLRCHGTAAYMDDGEATFGGDEFQRPTDYLRESLDSIEQAWIEAGLKQAQAAPQPDADGWIPWAGGDCPLERRVRHQVRFRYGDESHWSKCPYGWNWEHTGAPTDIIAYRIVEAKP